MCLHPHLLLFREGGEGKLLLSSLLPSQFWKLFLLLHIFYSSMPESLQQSSRRQESLERIHAVHQGLGSQRFLACIARRALAPLLAASYNPSFAKQLQGSRLRCALCTQATLSEQDPGCRRAIRNPRAPLALANSPLTLPALLGIPTGGDPSPT